MSVLFAFAAILALAAAQCSFEGNTYAYAGYSITYGVAVDDWVPAIWNMGDPSNVVFGTVKQATASRWEVQSVGSPNGEYCDALAQYNVRISAGCTEVRFDVIDDPCAARAEFLANTFVLEEVADGADCIAPGSELTGTFMQSEAQPILATEGVTWVFGRDEFAIASVGDVAAIFQRWSLILAADEFATEIRDFASAPAGYACSNSKVGVYNTSYTTDCAVRFCGIQDGCEARGELLHGVAINDWEAPEGDQGCYVDVLVPGYGGESKCSPDEAQWLGHPYDCVDQFEKGECMFCRGISNGVEVSLCLDRLGAQCEDIFETEARRAFCNLEFECPASTFSFSLVVFISALLAFFH